MVKSWFYVNDNVMHSQKVSWQLTMTFISPNKVNFFSPIHLKKGKIKKIIIIRAGFSSGTLHTMNNVNTMMTAKHK